MKEKSYEELVSIIGYVFKVYFKCKLQDSDWEHNELIIYIDHALTLLDQKELEIIKEDFFVLNKPTGYEGYGSKSTYYRKRKHAMAHLFNCLIDESVV